MSSLIIRIEGVNFEIKPEGYLYEGHYGCVFGIKETISDNMLILGDTFLRNYYSIYDMQNNRLGLATDKNGQVRVAIEDANSNKISYIILCGMQTVIIIVLIVCLKRNKKKMSGRVNWVQGKKVV